MWNENLERCCIESSSDNFCRYLSMIYAFMLYFQQFFFKENIRYREWTCRDLISLILETWLSQNVRTWFSILGTQMGSLKHLKNQALLLRLHGQFCVVSLPYMDNEWSVSERNLLSQRPEQANALATSTGRRLVMKCTWPRSRGTRLAPSTAGIQCLSLDKIRLHRYSY